MSDVGPFSGWSLESERSSSAGVYLGYLLSHLGCSVSVGGRVLDDASLVELLAEEHHSHAPRSVELVGPAGQRFRATFRTTPLPGADACDDTLAWAWGGLASLTGEADGPPCAPGAPVASMCGALHVLLAFAASLYGGRDQLQIEVDLSDVVASLTEVGSLQFSADGTVRSRNGDWWGRAGWGLYSCADGVLSVSIRDRQQLNAFGEAFGVAEIADARFDDFAWGMSENVDELNALVISAFLDRTVDEAIAMLRTLRIAAAPVRPLQDLASDPHLVARQSFQHVGSVALPRPPLPTGAQGEPASAGGDLPLAGMRVVDLSTVWAGPMAARLLADLGAEVVKVTDPTRTVGSYSTGKEWDRDFYSILNDRNKLVFGADLRQPEAKAWLADTLRSADILIENFGPGSAARLGLDAATLAEVAPQLAIVSMPALGLSGPDSGAVGYGSTIEQAAGLGWLYADNDGAPHRSGVNFSDPIAGLFAAVAAILMKVMARKGGLDLSQQDCALSLMTPTLARLPRGSFPARREAVESGDGWEFRCPGCGAAAPVRAIDQVAGSEAKSGSPCIEWVLHPDDKAYPLTLLPWQGDLARVVPPQPVMMPAELGAPPW